MCTAATYQTKGFYFGRTLDYEHSYHEEVTITPRNFPFTFRHRPDIMQHYAIVGMAYVMQDYPLYYDAMNEKGLAMAGLNFVGNAVYHQPVSGAENIAQFEFIPWVLSQCASVQEVRTLLQRTNLTGTTFHPQLPAAQLHWLIADRNEAITIESVWEGLRIYDNPVGVLTNNPTFPEHMLQLSNYLHLSPRPPKNLFAPKLELQPYSRGMGAIGLPGDLSSQSRFVRAAFVKMNAVSGDSEEESVGQFFHILGAVEQQRGCCELEHGKHEITIYTSCCSADKGIYYYTSYGNRQITAVDMCKENLDSQQLIRYPLRLTEQIFYQN